MLDPSDKQRVPGQFDEVATTYDLLTAFNPGYHKNLRASARRMALPPRARVLDLCCGTGSSTAALRACWPDAEITGLDASEGMLERARRKPELRATFLHGDAMDPAAAGAAGPYDGVLMAYGIRNVPDPDACLARIRDLLAPGGVLCLHEYSVADSWWARLKWEIVSRAVIIPGGWITAPRSDIYRYLHASVVAFDGARALEERMRRAGFVDVRTEPMPTWERGVVHSFLGRRPR
ncbi:MAG TPA: class I SAM-dependent methyltransferase [Myxococcota bacterium]|nr:class I SAM-dependent methyltransferase [Myxococcota bacterium]